MEEQIGLLEIDLGTKKQEFGANLSGLIPQRDGTEREMGQELTWNCLYGILKPSQKDREESHKSAMNFLLWIDSALHMEFNTDSR